MTKIVLGGGLSGLAATYYLLSKFPLERVTLLEAQNRLGGWIKSTQVNDTIFEQAARTIRPRGEAGNNTLKLIEDIGLSDKVIPISSNHPAAKNRMVFVNGKLHSLPSSLGSIFRTQEPFSRPIATFILKDLFSKKKASRDESIYDFVERRFGSEIADFLISPLICGICAGNAKEISVNFLFKQGFEYEQKYGSVVGGYIRNLFKTQKDTNKSVTENSALFLKAKKERWSVYSLKDGLEILPKTLQEYVKNKGAAINVNLNCEKIEFNNEGGVICSKDGKTFTGSHVISALPSFVLARMVEKQHSDLSKMLRQIKNVNVAVINLLFEKDLINKPAFGFLVPPKEQLPILGVIYDSCCFPNKSRTVLTVMMGGHWFEHYFGQNYNKDYLLNTALTMLKTILNITDSPTMSQINILEKCIPQYIVGHEENLKEINAYIDNHKLPLSLCGASYYGVGVNDVILSAKNAVESLNFK